MNNGHVNASARYLLNCLLVSQENNLFRCPYKWRKQQKTSKPHNASEEQLTINNYPVYPFKIYLCGLVNVMEVEI